MVWLGLMGGELVDNGGKCCTCGGESGDGK